MNYSNMTIGERIKALRTIKDQTRKESEPKMTQARLADLVETSQVQIARYENDQSQIPACDLPKFARALNTSVSFIVEAVDPENVTLAEELDLSDESIKILKETKKAFHGFISRNFNDIHCKYNISLNPISDVLDLLLKNQRLLIHLHNYFFNDLQELIVKLPPEYDQLTADDEVTIPQYESIHAIDIQNFHVPDMEGLARLEIMDDLKSIRDSLTEERKAEKDGND